MPHIHFDLVDADAVGATTGSPQTIGTVTTSADCTDILAVFGQSVSTGTRTTAEALQGLFILNPQGVLPEQITWQDRHAGGGGQATNLQGYMNRGSIVPLMPKTSNLANRSMVFSFDTAIESTSEYWAQAGVMYAEGGYPVEVMQNRDKVATRISWSGHFGNAAVGTALSEAFTNTLRIPSWVSEIVAIEINVMTDAVVTAAEHLGGYVEFAGTLPSTFPMKYPIPARGASLGTAADGDIESYSSIYPAYWRLPPVDLTITGTLIVDAVSTGENNVSVTLYGR
jgi:hypothetical protein